MHTSQRNAKMKRKILGLTAFVLALLISMPAMAWTKEECKAWDKQYGLGTAHQQDPGKCPDTTPPKYTYTPPPQYSYSTYAPATASAGAGASAGAAVETKVKTVGGSAPTTGGNAPVTGGTLTESQTAQQTATLGQTGTQGLSQSANTTGQATVTGSGNGGGAQITDQSKTENKVLVFTPVQVAALPQAMTVGNIRLEKVGECGPRYKVKAFTREHRTSGFFTSSEMKIPTAHGIADGFDDDQPLLEKRLVLPEPFNTTFVIMYGHQRYVSTETVNFADGKTMAANAVSERLAGGGGTGNTASTAVGVIGEYFVDCEYKKGELVVRTVQPTPTVVPLALPASSAIIAPKEPFVKSFKPKIVDDVPQKTCGGKPIPPGKRCAYIAEKAPAVVDVYKN